MTSTLTYRIMATTHCPGGLLSTRYAAAVALLLPRWFAAPSIVECRRGMASIPSPSSDGLYAVSTIAPINMSLIIILTPPPIPNQHPRLLSFPLEVGLPQKLGSSTLLQSKEATRYKNSISILNYDIPAQTSKLQGFSYPVESVFVSFYI